jgi:hypothetical protein
MNTGASSSHGTEDYGASILLQHQYEIFEQYVNTRQQVANDYFGPRSEHDEPCPLLSNYAAYRQATRRLSRHLQQWKEIEFLFKTDFGTPLANPYGRRRYRGDQNRTRVQGEGQPNIETNHQRLGDDSKALSNVVLSSQALQDHIGRTFRVLETILALPSGSTSSNALVPFSSSGIPIALRRRREDEAVPNSIPGDVQNESHDEDDHLLSDSDTDDPHSTHRNVQESEQQASLIVALTVLRASIHRAQEEFSITTR